MVHDFTANYKVLLIEPEDRMKKLLLGGSVTKKFDHDYKEVLGADLLNKKMITREESIVVKITLQIWCLSRKIIISPLKKHYFKSTSGSVLVCEMNREETVKDIPEWYGAVVKHDPEAINVLVGIDTGEENGEKEGKELFGRLGKELDIASTFVIAAGDNKAANEVIDFIAREIRSKKREK